MYLVHALFNTYDTYDMGKNIYHDKSSTFAYSMIVPVKVYLILTLHDD